MEDQQKKLLFPYHSQDLLLGTLPGRLIRSTVQVLLCPLSPPVISAIVLIVDQSNVSSHRALETHVVVLIHRISSLVGSKCGAKPLVVEEKGEKGAQSLQESRRRRREKARVGRWCHFFLHHLYSFQLDVSKQRRLGEGERGFGKGEGSRGRE